MSDHTLFERAYFAEDIARSCVCVIGETPIIFLDARHVPAVRVGPLLSKMDPSHLLLMFGHATVPKTSHGSKRVADAGAGGAAPPQHAASTAA